MILQNQSTDLGTIEISSEVIEVISSIAVEETKGVHSLQNNFASGNIEKLGKKFRGRGVKVDVQEGTIHIAITLSFQQIEMSTMLLNVYNKMLNKRFIIC